MTTTPLETLLDAFPDLAPMDGEARRLLDRSLRVMEVPAGTVLFSEGAACQAYVLVLGGSVRVQKVSESGREIVLYRVERGQTCVLTTACLMTRAEYGAEGVAETAVAAATLTAAAFEQLVDASPCFRRFVFAVYATRIADLLMLIEEVAFGRIDVRLAQVLLAHGQRSADGAVGATHQTLATELGTAREVVSRQLKEFERRGWVALSRGRIEVRDPASLGALGA
ncbi:Crp/Fnr family transcriptional regulator [Caenispirillum bisanense]|uniref:CRP/FNR family transcriptional regulator, anaerobic regulatory protein n=1 Tax=Caenispirillum bisanense TaxID=414052 RepID=A0A286G8Y3_9PROT|nr:Crp/Fnr family transcriptional regulator [Caenispirillum bisanense]SOD91981.1 CRP/FNR family transcriptional regulator, anaerobic regulatory protein [Caenispirillum bisanense]